MYTSNVYVCVKCMRFASIINEPQSLLHADMQRRGHALKYAYDTQHTHTHTKIHVHMCTYVLAPPTDAMCGNPNQTQKERIILAGIHTHACLRLTSALLRVLWQNIALV